MSAPQLEISGFPWEISIPSESLWDEYFDGIPPDISTAAGTQLTATVEAHFDGVWPDISAPNSAAGGTQLSTQSERSDVMTLLWHATQYSK